VIFFAILGFGILVGAIAQFIVGRDGGRIDWQIAIIAGLAGSFVGGLLASLIAGDGLALRPSGLIGSIVGAIIVTLIWRWYANKQRSAERAAAKPSRSGRHH
jgi:uncharacterized membrane protein YeaQ/YmgE (transglycosylase-associated protein family)